MKEAEKTVPVDIALVLGYIATKDLPTLEMKVSVLNQLGYNNKDMVKICGSTANAVKTLKSKTKKGQ